MASSISSLLKRVLATFSTRTLTSRAAARRGFCHSTTSYYPFQALDSYLPELANSLFPNLVTLQSSFSAPDVDRDIRRGFGVFLDPTFIVTSAHAVGRVTTSSEPKTLAVDDEPDRFDHDRIRHKSCIASILARTLDGRTMRAQLLAVSFSKDVAVLRVNEGENLFAHSVKVVDTNLPRQDDVVVAIARTDLFMGNVRAAGERTVRAKALWPLEDKLGWMEMDWTMWYGGSPPRGCALTGSITGLSGSPWFNLRGELVGVASWEVVDQAPEFAVRFAVPPSCVRDVVDYAKSKAPEDPIVMDSWIDG